MISAGEMPTSEGLRMMQGSMPESIRDRALLARALFPALAAELDSALMQHGEPDQGAVLDSWLDARAAEVRAGAGLDEVVNPEVAARLQRSFLAASDIATRLSSELPEPEAFIDAGIDLARIEAQLEADATFVPVIAPHGLGAEAWVSAYTDEPASTTLVVAREALTEFALLDSAPNDTPTVTRGGAVWTLRLIPGAQKPKVLGLDYAHGPHPTLPEMLTLQFMRLLAGESPLDASSFTWIAGRLAEGRLAARHVYDASEQTVRITCREVGSQGPHLGARPPIG